MIEERQWPGLTGAFGISLALHFALLIGWVWQKPPVPTPPPAVMPILVTQLIAQPPVAALTAHLPVPQRQQVPTTTAETAPARQHRQAQQKLAQQSVQEQQHLREQQARQAQLQRERLQREEAELKARQQAEREHQAALEAEARARRDAEQAAQAAIENHDYAPLHKPVPEYPERALNRGIEGDCTVEYTVTAAGQVADPQVVGDCHPLFIRASLTAAEAFRYQPRRVNGQPQAVANVRNTFHYRIEDQHR